MSRKKTNPKNGNMDKRGNTATNRKKNTARSRKSSGCTALVVVDTERVRKKAIASCKRARTTFRKAQEQLDYFEQQENPAYENWLHKNLGPEITSVRELSEERDRKVNLYENVRLESLLSGEPEFVCYERLKNGESIFDQSREQSTGEGEFADEEEDGEEEGDEDDFDFDSWEEEFWRKMFGWANGEFESDEESGPEETETGQPEDNSTAAKRDKLKKTYRHLCRRLHPDAGGEGHTEERELWHETQQAYQEEDLERLELLIAKTDLRDGQLGASTPVSNIMRITEDFREARKSIRSLVNRAKRQLSWGFFSFSEEKKKTILKKKRKAYNGEAQLLRSDIAQLDSVFEELEEAARIEERRRNTTPTRKTNRCTHSQSRRKGNGKKQSRSRRQEPEEQEHPGQMFFDFMAE